MPRHPHAPKARTARSDAGEVYLLLDRSGSMGVRWPETLSAINGYVSKLAAIQPDLTITLALFDGCRSPATKTEGGWFHILRERTPAKAWKPVTDQDASPRGTTPLYDAVERLVKLADQSRAARGVLVIMTDGQENASRRATRASAQAALDRSRERGWQVVFLGAEFDNVEQAESIGGSASQAMSLSAGRYSASMEVLASSTLAYADQGVSMTFDGPPMERAKTLGPGKTLFFPLEGDDLTMLVLAMQNGISDMEGYDEPLRIRLTEIMRRVDEPMYTGLVEQGDIKPLEGDGWRAEDL